jgi:hypothetical protein
MSRLSLKTLSVAFLAVGAMASPASANKGRALVPYNSAHAKAGRATHQRLSQARQQKKTQKQATRQKKQPKPARAFKIVMREFKARLLEGNMTAADKLLTELKTTAKGGGIFRKSRIRSASKRLRKLLESEAGGSIRRGELQQDHQLRQHAGEFKQQRRQVSKEIRELIQQVGGRDKLTAEQKQEIRDYVKEIPKIGKTRFHTAVKILERMNDAAKNQRGPVRRMFASVGGFFFGSAGRSLRKTNRALIDHAKRLAKKGDVDSASGANLLLSIAKQRKLATSRTYRKRYKKALDQAYKSINKTISRAVKEGDPAAVKNAHTLKLSYYVERRELRGKTPSQRKLKKLARQSNTDLLKAEKKAIFRIIKQANWILYNPQMAGQMGYTSEAVEAALDAAATLTNKLEREGKAPRGAISKVQKLRKRYNGRNVYENEDAGAGAPPPVAAPKFQSMIRYVLNRELQMGEAQQAATSSGPYPGS